MNLQKTFYDVSELWCEAKRPIVKHSTMCAYLLTLQTHLLPRFGTMEIITENDVQQFVIDKCTVKKETDASTFTGQQNLTFSGDAAALGTCATTVEGTVESGALTMNINVKVATLQQTVKVTYSGVKQVEESGND